MPQILDITLLLFSLCVYTDRRTIQSLLNKAEGVDYDLLEVLREVATRPWFHSNIGDCKAASSKSEKRMLSVLAQFARSTFDLHGHPEEVSCVQVSLRTAKRLTSIV